MSPGVTLDDIQAVFNMRDAWRYLVNAIDQPIKLLSAYYTTNDISEIKIFLYEHAISGIDFG